MTDIEGTWGWEGGWLAGLLLMTLRAGLKNSFLLRMIDTSLLQSRSSSSTGAPAVNILKQILIKT